VSQKTGLSSALHRRSVKVREMKLRSFRDCLTRNALDWKRGGLVFQKTGLNSALHRSSVKTREIKFTRSKRTREIKLHSFRDCVTRNTLDWKLDWKRRYFGEDLEFLNSCAEFGGSSFKHATSHTTAFITQTTAHIHESWYRWYIVRVKLNLKCGRYQRNKKK
jgi:hypothetical protein